jgi:two-component system OmpR family sensor kinase
LGSSFTLFAIIAYLFYQNELHFFYDSTQNRMQLASNKIASQITHAHMSGESFSFEKAMQNSPYNIGFFDKNHQVIASNLSDDNSSIKIIDYSTFGHLGVNYIIIEKEGIDEVINSLRYKIVIVLAIIYIIIGVIGYFLAKLFIKPIQLKRIQLDNFIKDSTHELNTPVTALMLSVNSPMLNSPKNLERIRLSASRISEIHKDLSYLLLNNQIKSDKSILLNEIIKKQLSYLGALAEQKRVKLSVEYLADLYFAIDEDSFIRLINNLVSNAIKYNKIGGSVDIVIDKNSITISDTGIGIPLQDQKEIYNRFYRATNQVGGFGLGLNIVYNIVKAYGSGIEMSSELNKGTVFRLIF